MVCQGGVKPVCLPLCPWRLPVCQTHDEQVSLPPTAAGSFLPSLSPFQTRWRAGGQVFVGRVQLCFWIVSHLGASQGRRRAGGLWFLLRCRPGCDVGLCWPCLWCRVGEGSLHPFSSSRVLLPTVLRLFCSFHGHAPLLPFSTSSSLFQIVGRGMWNAVRHRNPVLTRMRSASHLLGNSFQWNMLSQRKERMTQRFVVRGCGLSR